MSSTKNQQCDRCLHKDVCRYIQTIEEIKEKYPFVSSVTCNYSIRRSASSMANIEPNTEEQGEPGDREMNPASGEEKPEKQMKPGDDSDGNSDEPLTVMDLDVAKIGLPDNKIVKALKSAGIEKVRDVYEYEKTKGWSSAKGLTKDMLKKLSDLLTALSQPALKL